MPLFFKRLFLIFTILSTVVLFSSMLYAQEDSVDVLYEKAVAVYDHKLYLQAKDKFLEVEQKSPGYKDTKKYLVDIENAIAANNSTANQSDIRDEAKAEIVSQLVEVRKEENQELVKAMEDKEVSQSANVSSEEQAKGIYDEALKAYRAKQYEKAKEQFDLLEQLIPNYKQTRSYIAKIDKKIIAQRERLAKQESQKNKLASSKDQDKEIVETARAVETKDPAIAKIEKERREQIIKEAENKYAQALEQYRLENYVEAKIKFIQVEAVYPGYKKTQDYLARIDNDIAVKYASNQSTVVSASEPQKEIEIESIKTKEQETVKKEPEEATSVKKAPEKEKAFPQKKRQKDVASKDVAEKVAPKKKSPPPRVEKATVVNRYKDEKVEVVVLNEKNFGEIQSVDTIGNDDFQAAQDRVLSELPTEEYVDLSEVISLYSEGEDAFNSGKLDVAKEKFDRVSSLSPGFKQTDRYLKRINRELKKIAKLQEKAIQETESLQKEQEKLSQEVKELEKVVVKEPVLAQTEKIEAPTKTPETKENALADQIEALYQDGLVLYRKENLSEAKAKFEEVSKLQQNYKSTQRYLRRIENKLGQNKIQTAKVEVENKQQSVKSNNSQEDVLAEEEKEEKLEWEKKRDDKVAELKAKEEFLEKLNGRAYKEFKQQLRKEWETLEKVEKERQERINKRKRELLNQMVVDDNAKRKAKEELKRQAKKEKELLALQDREKQQQELREKERLDKEAALTEKKVQSEKEEVVKKDTEKEKVLEEAPKVDEVQLVEKELPADKTVLSREERIKQRRELREKKRLEKEELAKQKKLEEEAAKQAKAEEEKAVQKAAPQAIIEVKQDVAPEVSNQEQAEVVKKQIRKETDRTVKSESAKKVDEVKEKSYREDAANYRERMDREQERQMALLKREYLIQKRGAKRDVAHLRSEENSRWEQEANLLYTEGARLYKEGRYLEAKIKFNTVEGISPGYRQAKAYIQKLNTLIEREEKQKKAKEVKEAREQAKKEEIVASVQEKVEAKVEPLPVETPKIEEVKKVEEPKVEVQEAKKVEDTAKAQEEIALKQKAAEDARIVQEQARLVQEQAIQKAKEERLQQQQAKQKAKEAARLKKEQARQEAKILQEKQNQLKKQIDQVYAEALTLYEANAEIPAQEKFKEYDQLLLSGNFPPEYLSKMRARYNRDRERIAKKILKERAAQEKLAAQNRAAENVEHEVKSTIVDGTVKSSEVLPVPATQDVAPVVEQAKPKELTDLEKKIKEDEKRLAKQKEAQEEKLNIEKERAAEIARRKEMQEQLREERLKRRKEKQERQLRMDEVKREHIEETKKTKEVAVIEEEPVTVASSEEMKFSKAKAEAKQKPEPKKLTAEEIARLSNEERRRLEKDKRDELHRLMQERQAEIRTERERVQQDFDESLNQLYTKGVGLYNQGEYASATKIFTEIERMQPNYKKSLKYLKDIQQKQRQARAAKAEKSKPSAKVRKSQPTPVRRTEPEKAQTASKRNSPSRLDLVSEALDHVEKSQ